MVSRNSDNIGSLTILETSAALLRAVPGLCRACQSANIPYESAFDIQGGASHHSRDSNAFDLEAAHVPDFFAFSSFANRDPSTSGRLGFASCTSRRLGGSKIDKPVKIAELETLVASKDEVGEDRPEGVFYARALPRAIWESPWMEQIERVVLVHRLREVIAEVAFTRFEAAAPDIEGELDIGVRRAPRQGTLHHSGR